jgi:hypothetical protein
MWPKLKAYVRVHRVNDAVEIAVILQSRFRQVQITNVGESQRLRIRRVRHGGAPEQERCAAAWGKPPCRGE